MVPGNKTKFKEAALDVPLIEREEVVFEAHVQSLSSRELVVPE